jgi:hypothetical protein
MAVFSVALAGIFALAVFDTASAAQSAGNGTHPVALALCEGRPGAGWTVLDPRDTRRRVATTWLRTLVGRDAERLAGASSLPLHVRYPKRYLERGTRVEYAIDEEATTRAAALSLLQGLIDHEQLPNNGHDELRLLANRGSYQSSPRGGGAVVIQICPEVHADGTYETIELTLKHSRGNGWEIHGIEVGWESYM